MRSRPERLRGGAPLAAAALIALALTGCGKANLRRGPRDAAAAGHSAVASRARRRAATPAGPEVAVPLPLTSARADGFARAVSLSAADVPGTSPVRRTSTPRSQQREAEQCGERGTLALGGGRSAQLQRGDGLDRESISSAVEVLQDTAAVRSDEAYAASRAGVACYAKVLGRSLRREQSGGVRLLGLHVGRLAVTVGAAERASGLRVTARVGIAHSALQVPVFVDALSLPYGPAELDLYTTSFVQPVAEKTQQELLSLLRERALLHAL